MSMIIDKLPYYVVIQGKKYKINVDYRCILMFERIMQDTEIKDSEKIIQSLKVMYPSFFEILAGGREVINEAINCLVWFYKCGRDKENHKPKMKGKSSSQKRPIYSYELDDQYIYGAFLHDYGIDLTKDKLHWWKFRALELSLNEKNEYVKIKGYRSYNGKDQDMNNLKEYWQLPLPKNVIDEADKIAEQLMKKGD